MPDPDGSGGGDEGGGWRDGGDGDRDGGESEVAGGARISATSGRWVSFRALPDSEDDPDRGIVEILPTDAKGVRVADAEGRVDWEDGPKIGAVTMPVAIAA